MRILILTIYLLLLSLVTGCVSTASKRPAGNDSDVVSSGTHAERKPNDPQTPLSLHAAIKGGVDVVIETYLSEDYPQTKYELEALLKRMDPLPLASRADKINHLDTHYPPIDQALSFAIIDDDLRWRNVQPAAPVTVAQVAETSKEWEKAEVPDQLFEEKANKASIEKPRLKSGSYFKRGLHKFIQQEIREVAIRMGEPKVFKLPDDFVKEIEYYIRRFQNEPYYQKFFRATLQRSRKYVPALREIFREKNFPEEIIYLAFIESGFNPVAYSRSHAAGMFQFIKSTGRQYGLAINRQVDERYSPFKSAVACREYLHDLLLELGSFTLALSSYNSGAGKTRQALRQLDDYRDRSFWTLREKTKVLKHETREYIPQIFAAIVMAKPGNPERFGFSDVPFPERYEMVIVPSRVNLSALAGAANITVPNLLQYNPDLPRNATHTPKRVIDYPLLRPRSAKNAIASAVAKLTRGQKRITTGASRTSGSGSQRYHRVKKGESLWLIARKYKVSVNQLKQWNGLKSSQIYAGKKLVVYGKTTTRARSSAKVRKVEQASAGLKSRPGVGGTIVSQRISAGESFRYMVASGNSLGEIAALFGVSVAEIKRWNSLRGNTIRSGQKLKLVARRQIQYYQYRVQSGDSISEVAERFGVRISAVQFANGKSNHSLRVGEILKIFSL